jgi:hypothetical protein
VANFPTTWPHKIGPFLRYLQRAEIHYYNAYLDNLLLHAEGRRLAPAGHLNIEIECLSVAPLIIGFNHFGVRPFHLAGPRTAAPLWILDQNTNDILGEHKEKMRANKAQRECRTGHNDRPDGKGWRPPVMLGFEIGKVGH